MNLLKPIKQVCPSMEFNNASRFTCTVIFLDTDSAGRPNHLGDLESPVFTTPIAYAMVVTFKPNSGYFLLIFIELGRFALQGLIL
jgi:hypothetical protein